MKTWIIEPRDPLIVRDGRPFGPNPGARAVSLDFPFPSTTTGGLRTRAGSTNGVFDESPSNITRVKGIPVRGPVLVELDNSEHEIVEWFVHAPADAVLFDLNLGNEQRVALRQLLPHKLPAGAATNLPDGLLPVCLRQPEQQKVTNRAPRYWRWKRFEQWLLAPADTEEDPAQLGHNGPVQESRIHVRVQFNTQTAAEGALFQTRGLEFACPSQSNQISLTRRLALAVTTTDDSGVSSGLASLGGERRMVTWRESAKQLPECPQALRSKIMDAAACRIVLLTPAYFTGGYRPQQLLEPLSGVTPELIAVAISRPQVVSGWDYEKKGPKPTRRLAPAGTVFFLKLDGSTDAISQWIDNIWMQCVSDTAQDAQDGFGLAVLGFWSGECPLMEVKG